MQKKKNLILIMICMSGEVLEAGEGEREFTEISCLAIDTFNSQNNTKFKFVENLTVTTAIAAGYWLKKTSSQGDEYPPYSNADYKAPQ
ncbi:hypothetical protein RDI58_013507 [Solanum bulbocastanum]|uniref:Uncharacterized protein n=1 Tax=Solanum bulbocastanum TaxID=147425 RepID=A0AAN8TQW3_SOLBU